MISAIHLPIDWLARSWPRTARPTIRPLQFLTGLTGEDVLSKMGRSLASVYMDLMIAVDIQRYGPLPAGPKILAINHPTSIDPFYILALLDEPLSVLITAAAFEKPIIGPTLKAMGHIPAVRGSGGSTVEALVRQVDSGRSVAIFPEGALSPIGGFHRPHSGLARVALSTGAPVLPVGIGLQQDRIRVSNSIIDGEQVTGHLYASGPYAMTVGRPLTFNGDPHDRQLVKATTIQIMNHIQRLAFESQSRIQALAGTETDAIQNIPAVVS